jgi:hypothetical protein
VHGWVRSIEDITIPCRTDATVLLSSPQSSPTHYHAESLFTLEPTGEQRHGTAGRDLEVARSAA